MIDKTLTEIHFSSKTAFKNWMRAARKIPTRGPCWICDTETEVVITHCHEDWCKEPHDRYVCDDCAKTFCWYQYARLRPGFFRVNTEMARHIYRTIKQRLQP